MADKIILITGASSGFGRETALGLLVSGGWTVYAASRNTAKMADLEKAGARLISMDVSRDGDVAAGVTRVLEESGRIDCLFANAGYGSYGSVENVPLDEARYQYEVNVFGTARTVRAVLPAMREQGGGRIVLTTSMVSRLSTAMIGWYASTKHALRAIGTSLRQELGPLGISVVMIEPGLVKTGFDSVALETLGRVAHSDEYGDLVAGMTAFARRGYARCPGPSGTVRKILKAITKKRPKAIYRTTADSRFLPRLVALFGPRLSDRVILAMLRRAARKSRN